jgi:putative ABC transport system permease protein
MLLFKLAIRNLLGAGLRTWLNVGVLSFCYVLITLVQGIYSGWLRQGMNDEINEEIGGGQYWQENYSPYDPLTLDDSHARPSRELQTLVDSGQAAEILIRQASIFPKGRAQQVLLKGINPSQRVLKLPTSLLVSSDGTLPVLIGARMAKRNELKMNDLLTIRFRDVHGTFDAREGRITGIMATNVPTIDTGQLWIPLDEMRRLTGIAGESTILVTARGSAEQAGVHGWVFKSSDFLLQDLKNMVRSKRMGSAVVFTILLFLAVIAVFDTQILSIFRRRKEIGTLIALGMTKFRVILLFTLEGAMNGILALAAGAVYGAPLMWYLANYGILMPVDTSSYGIAMSARLLPAYSLGLVTATALIVMGAVTVVSYLPTRDIARLKPVEALKGKLS